MEMNIIRRISKSVVLLLFISLILLSGCVENINTNYLNESYTNPSYSKNIESKVMEISSSNGDYFISYPDISILTISGSNNNIEIKEDVRINKLLITGSNNDIYIHEKVEINEIEILGDNNDIDLPEELRTLMNIDGVNNDIDYY